MKLNAYQAETWHNKGMGVEGRCVCVGGGGAGGVLSTQTYRWETIYE